LNGKFRRRLERFLSGDPLEMISRLVDYYYLLKSQFYYKRFFGAIGENSRLIRPMRLKNVGNVFLRDNVIINKFAFIITVPAPDAAAPVVVVDSGTIIGHFNHIASVNSVYIGKNVLTADKVYISDHNHQYADIRKPVMDQGTYSNGVVRIGDGSWIGENVCIVSAKIGRNCVVAANSVVTKDIPDYCVAAGIPARVIKRYDHGSDRWEKPPCST
jgi:acetyltransferase-like isoleucine patch superfamily enzyme